MDDWQRLRELVTQATPAERELIRAMIGQLRPVAEIEAAIAVLQAETAKTRTP